MRRYHITVGAKTTANGTVQSGCSDYTIDVMNQAREGDQVYCPTCATTGVIICEGPRLSDTVNGRNLALGGDLCRCKCNPLPRLIANQTQSYQVIHQDAPPAHARSTTASATQPAATRAPRSNLTLSSIRPSPTFTEAQVTSCENIWREYQNRAEAIVAPGGTLIADPKARNRAINAAYAQLWRLDQRFQWAGLAAFASKQVGCGLLHAADSIEKIQAEYEAAQRLKRSARQGVWGLLNPSERERQATLREYEKRLREYEQARRNNPVPSIDMRREGEPLSSVQQLYQHVYEMLAMGNTTLFLDVFPLHAFYKDKGLHSLKMCLPSRKNIYGNGQAPVLWPIGQRKLTFGIDHQEILQAFEAIDDGNIAKGVEYLAWHEQQNILQPTLYSDTKLINLLRSNHLSYVTGIPSGVAQAIELTLTSQCQPADVRRTIGFSDSPFADLADIDQRMAFVLKAAAQFDDLLHTADRLRIEEAIDDIVEGRGVQ